MAPRKANPKPKPIVVAADPVDVTPTAAGPVGFVNLDPVDGRPVFAEGMSRRRWLDAHADERRAQLLEHLTADPGDHDPFDRPESDPAPAP